MSAGARFVVGPDEARLRVDQALPALAPVSRRRARALLAAGAVRRNGEPLRVQGRQLAAGDVLDVLLDGAEGEALRAASVASAPPPFMALRDDGWLLAVDKPAGVLSQPAERRDETAPASDLPTARSDELAMDERVLLRRAFEVGRPPFLRLVHRLDRVTSGVLLFAAREASLVPLARAWREGAVTRRYLALVDGGPKFDERVIDAPIARDRTHAWRFETRAGGEASTTRVRVLAATADAALVACDLITGRTHQVRVHLAHLGHPVRGDRLYGSTSEAPRSLLHAASLALPHPRGGERVTIAAPLPDDLLAAARALGLGDAVAAAMAPQ